MRARLRVLQLVFQLFLRPRRCAAVSIFRWNRFTIKAWQGRAGRNWRAISSASLEVVRRGLFDRAFFGGWGGPPRGGREFTSMATSASVTPITDIYPPEAATCTVGVEPWPQDSFRPAWRAKAAFGRCNASRSWRGDGMIISLKSLAVAIAHLALDQNLSSSPCCKIAIEAFGSDPAFS